MLPKKKKTTKKITIHDIARHTSVSYQTVSRVINNNGSVAEETRKRVLQAMRELDFVPSKVARMLSTNQSHTLELIAVDVTHGGRFADSIKNMALAAKSAGYDLLIIMIAAEELAFVLEDASAKMVDGVVIYAPSLHISDEKLLELCADMPLVRRDYVPDSRLAWIGFDQVYSARLATEYLIELGHRQIAAIPPSLDLINGRLRFATWEETLLKHALEPGPWCAADYTYQSGYEAAKYLLATQRPFTALLAGSDTIAFGAMRALREAGLRLPEDVSIVSFDNADLAKFTEPPLTTVDFSFSQQDTMAIKYLIEILHHPEMQLHQRVLLPNLIVRESTQKIDRDVVGSTIISSPIHQE